VDSGKTVVARLDKEIQYGTIGSTKTAKTSLQGLPQRSVPAAIIMQPGI
jgi:hypothetical protein